LTNKHIQCQDQDQEVHTRKLALTNPVMQADQAASPLLPSLLLESLFRSNMLWLLLPVEQRR